MSRIGKQPIKIPELVNVKIDKQNIAVKGPKGNLSLTVSKGITAEIIDKEIIVTRKNDEKENRSLHGLNRVLIDNMIVGVSEGYMKKLFVVGTGYKVAIQGKWLILSLGFSHDVYVEMPKTVEVQTEKISRAAASDIPELQAIIDLYSCDKELLGNVTASIRAVRPPGAFNKCKGIRYSDERVKKKPGKVAGGTDAG
ncbi:MAG: 50S ribosomal protein L6 [Candidatus Cloacimonadota bacterium]|nr:50S ribosomal protein L6 [Candidatus Cloacimonadota bacterium]